MMVMNRFLFRFKQFGGIELLKAYVRKGVFLNAIGQFLLVISRRKTLVQADSAIRRKIAPKLKKEFLPVMREAAKRYTSDQVHHERCNKVWFCWLQGLDQAPDVVKMCYASLKRHMKDREIVVLTNDNLFDYVSFPDFVMEKYNKGIIDNTRLSDMLRLELLIRYGGSWLDSTVFCSSDGYPRELLDNDLFVYQLVRKDCSGFVGLSNWFITACTNNRLLLILRDMHYEYWKRYNCVIDYFFFHLFFTMIAREYPEEVLKMPKYSNRWPLLLATRFAEDYDEEWMNKLCQRTCFHKLTYRLKDHADRTGTFYDMLIRSNMR